MKEYDVSRFVDAQKRDYEIALSEIKSGKKYSHWIWYIFSQLRGLGKSWASNFYGVENLDEAKAILDDSYLGKNLREICTVLLELDESNPTVIFGRPDDMKLKSSMTLFKYASPNEVIFKKVLEKYFNSCEDKRTVKMLGL